MDLVGYGVEQSVEANVEAGARYLAFLRDRYFASPDIPPAARFDLTLAVDGVILRGVSSFDESLLTGEATPLLREPGDRVVAGSVNGEQPVDVHVTHTVQGSAVSEIRHLVEGGLEQRPRYAMLAERAATVFIAAFVVFRGLYGLPFLVGLWGMGHHFYRDWKRASAVLALFFLTGLAILLYVNQPDPQPRERDYAYAGSFYAFAIWIGIGVAALTELLNKKINFTSLILEKNIGKSYIYFKNYH